MKSMKISTIQQLSEKKMRPFRLGFSRYLVERYGMSMSTSYQKIRQNRVRPWEVEGIERCIEEFAPDYNGDLSCFYENLSGKKQFMCFMNERGMSSHTVRERFRKFDFTEIELRGLGDIYNEYKKDIEETER